MPSLELLPATPVPVGDLEDLLRATLGKELPVPLMRMTAIAIVIKTRNKNLLRLYK